MDEPQPNRVASDDRVGMPSPESLAQIQSDISEALAYFANGQVADAEACLNRALLSVPEYPEVLHLLRVAAKLQGDHVKAAKLIERALDRVPHHTIFHNNLGNILLDAGESEAAINHYRQAIRAEPAYVDAHFNLGIGHERQGQTQEAIASYRQTLVLNPEYIEARHNLGSALESLGLIEDALIEYRKVIAISPDYARAYFRIAYATPDRVSETERQAMEHLLAKLDPSSDAAIHLNFGLGRAYADIGRPEDAFIQWEQGNKAKRATYIYDVANSTQLHQRIASEFTSGIFRTHARQGHEDDAPIFVVGMPRSGTTLVEQILSSHPRVSGAGELPIMRNVVLGISGQPAGRAYPESIGGLSEGSIHSAALEYLRALRARDASAPHIVDKMPGNFLYIGMIKLLLPNARIVHCVRDPIATCFSCFTQLFNAPQRFAYDLTELGTYHSSYRRLMSHWHRVLPGEIFDIRYEDLVEAQEATTRRLLEFCGLDWNDSCLTFHETQRSVRTSSAEQVRRPLYKSSVMGWRRYKEYLAPLLEALD